MIPSPVPREDHTFRDWFGSFDWAATGLGSRAQWEPPLSTLAALALDTCTPVFIAWGDELRLVYNEAYTQILGDKHPAALGQPLQVVWPEIWDDIQPLIRRTLGGEAIARTDVEFCLDRRGCPERTWFSFSYSPIRCNDGRIAGVYSALIETTDKVLTDQGRATALARLRQLFDQAPGFMAVTSGPEHRVELVNEACKQLIGRSDVVGKPLREAVPELAQQVYLSLFDQVYATGEAYVGKQMEVFFQPPGEPLSMRYVDFVFQPVTARDGQVAAVFVQGIDVTEQRSAERQLRDSELKALELAAESESHARKLDALLQAAPVGILYADASGRIDVLNPAIRAAWGAIPQTNAIEDYTHFKAWWADGSDRQGQPLAAADWPLARALAGEENARAIIQVQPFHQPSQRRTVKLQAKPVRSPAGRIVGAVVAEMDITEQLDAQNRLRESEARFRTITDAMPQMVWSTRADGHHDYYNHGWYEYTGLAVGSTDGEAWIQVLHPDDREEALNAWRHSLTTGESYQVEHRFRHHTGEYRWTLGRALPVRDEAGRIVRWMGTSTDIHEQKLAQQDLQDASRRKDEFLAMLAHELRNPLAPISASAHLLSREPGDRRVRELGHIVERQALHMTRLVDDLLDVSRVTRGLSKLDRDVVDLGDVVRSAIEQVTPLVDERAHALTLDAPDGPIRVWGDRVRLIQVVANLLSNAAKYTRHGGRIDVTLERGDADACIRVRDNGSGIEPELLPLVFDAFTQGQRGPDRSQGGLGLGLALARGIVNQHGGAITAESAGRGEGSCFLVTLPLADIGNTPAPVDAGPQQVDVDATRPLQVMVVDDNVDAATTVALLLEMAGHQVRMAHDGASALAESAAAPADAYLLDIGLPDMSGYELARELRATSDAAHARIFALTGYGRSEDRTLSGEAGFDRHFVKPVDPAVLLAALHQPAGRPRMPA